MPRALIFANGVYDDPQITRSIIEPGDVLIAADGGAREIKNLGMKPAIIIGDLDSLTESEVEAFTKMEIQIHRFPTGKDETDLELALAHALQAGYHPIVIVGGLGGRLDQTLGNISLLSDPMIANQDIRLDDGITETFFVHGNAVIKGSCGDTVSFIPWGSLVQGVSTEGLQYPLNNENLLPFRTRGISNEMQTSAASVSIKSGQLLCIHIRKN